MNWFMVPVALPAPFELDIGPLMAVTTLLLAGVLGSMLMQQRRRQRERVRAASQRYRTAAALSRPGTRVGKGRARSIRRAA